MEEKLFGDDYPDFTEFGDPPCASSFPDAFFSDDAPDSALIKRGRYTYERNAKEICLSCVYQPRCLAYALKYPKLDGIWGATTEYDRQRIRRGVKVDITILPPNRNL